MADAAALWSRIQPRLSVCSDTGCHEWTGWRNEKGYGRVDVSDSGMRVVLFVHRIAWEAANGRALEPGEIVMHRCDNPRCCNPDHLLVGSNQDNVRDMVEKGRKATRRSCVRLTAREVALARLRFVHGHSVRSVAKRLGCGDQTARDIRDRNTWKNVPVPEHPLKGYDPMTDDGGGE